MTEKTMTVQEIAHDMGNVIPIDDNNMIDGKDLHRFLMSKMNYNSWIKYQLKRGKFINNRDYEVYTKISVNPSGGRPLSDYRLTIDTAKHIAMMSNTDKGCEVREYFLEIERRYNKVRDLLLSEKKLRLESKEARKSFTEILKLSGVSKPLEYAGITCVGKKSLHIPLNKPKENYTRTELLETKIAEGIAELKIITEKRLGYEDCRKAMVDAGKTALSIQYPNGVDSTPPIYIDNPSLSPRENLVSLVRYVATTENLPAKDVWVILYNAISGNSWALYKKAKKNNMSIIDYIEKHYNMDDVLDKAKRYLQQWIYTQRLGA